MSVSSPESHAFDVSELDLGAPEPRLSLRASLALMVVVSLLLWGALAGAAYAVGGLSAG